MAGSMIHLIISLPELIFPDSLLGVVTAQNLVDYLPAVEFYTSLPFPV